MAGLNVVFVLLCLVLSCSSQSTNNNCEAEHCEDTEMDILRAEFAMVRSHILYKP